MGRSQKLEAVLFDRGITAIRRNRYAEAERIFTKALQVHPGWHDALQRRAFAREQIGKLKQAAADYRKTLARWPRCRWCLEAAADLQVKFNRNAAAQRLYDRALRVAPRNSSFRLSRAFIRMSLDRFRAALADFSRIRSHRTLGMLATVGCGQARAMLGDYRASLKEFDRAIRMRPGVRENHFFRGIVRFLSKDVEGALEDFKEARLGRARRARLTRSKREFKEALTSGEASRWLYGRL